MAKKQAEGKTLRIGFIHPDLGIGGAERLVVDAAVSLQRRGHEVVIFTSRHDPKRCFEETKDGTLQVHVLGSSLPMRLHPKLPLTIVFSILRSLLLTTLLLFSLLLPGPASPFNPLSPLKTFDVFIVDQQSVCVPLLRFVSGSRVVFYCHFPDKLLSAGWSIGPDGKSTRRTGGLMRRVYRWPIDKLEEFTTGQSDIILANSKFTASVYTNAFPSLRKRTPRVVYPCIDVEQYSPSKAIKGKSKADRAVDYISSDRPTLVSLNRFEAKKNVELAIRAFAAVFDNKRIPEMRRDRLRLVIAGGYDPQLPENAETLERLQTICDTHNLSHCTLSAADLATNAEVERPSEDCQVLFILNFTNAQRAHLLTSPNTLGLLYTPTNEHFGIVPIEAGACGLPVIATNTGGPLETIQDPTTGFLRQPTVQTWAEALESLILMNPGQRKRMGEEAKKRVREMFSLETLGENLESACVDAIKMGDIHTQVGDKLIWGGASIMAAAVAALVLTVWYS